MNFKETEKKIKDYYESLKVIERLKYELADLKENKKRIENRIYNFTGYLYLEDNFRAIRYDKINSKTGGIKLSPQERALEKAFNDFEKSLGNTEMCIHLTEEKISRIETDNSNMKYILKDIKSEYKTILEGFYKNNKSYIQLSLELNMDKATIYRKRDKVIRDIKKCLEYYEKFSNVRK